MGVVMSPVNFLEERQAGPCEFGTHHEFGGNPCPWRTRGHVATGTSSAASSGPIEAGHPPPGWSEETESEEVEESPQPKERPWKRSRFDDQ